jgi:uncharacterized membrane protein
MSQTSTGWTDKQVEVLLGQLLRIGVSTAAAVVLLGGALFLVYEGRQPAHYHVFEEEPAELRSPVGIFREALALHSAGIIQFGLLLLIATPVARVVLSIFAFARQRDLTYVIITLIVLAVLLFSFFSGHL